MRKLIVVILLTSTLSGCFNFSKFWDTAVLSESIIQTQGQIDAELKLLSKIKLPKDVDNQIYIEYAEHLKNITTLEKGLRHDYKNLVKIVKRNNPHTFIVNIILIAVTVLLAVFLLVMTIILKRSK